MNEAHPADQQPDDAASREIRQIEQQEKRQGRHLAILLFSATLLGSLLGAIADLSEAQVLVYPVLHRIYPSPSLSVLGSYTLLDKDTGISEAWIQAFNDKVGTARDIPVLGKFKQHPDIEILAMDEVEGKRIAGSEQGAVFIATEPLSDSDLAELAEKGITVRCAADIGYDVIAFVGHLDDINPPLSMQDLQGILTGQITDWEELGREKHPINVIADPDSGATDLVLTKLTGSNEFSSNFLKCESETHCLDLALSTPGSLVWVSASWLKDQPKHYVNTFRIKRDGYPPQDPMQEDFDPDNYPPELIRPLYIYALSSASTSAESAELAVKFVHFVRGVRGQEILEKHDFYTYFDPPIQTKIDLPDGFGIRLNDVPLVCR